MFNFSGSEIVFLLLLALIILGPEKLPEAVRKFGSTYAELKKMSTGFQTELKQALDEPMREMRETADAFKKAASFDVDLDPRKLLDDGATPAAATGPVASTPTGETPAPPAAEIVREPGLNFASAAPRRGVSADEPAAVEPAAGSVTADAEPTPPPVEPAPVVATDDGAAPPLAPRDEPPQAAVG